MESSKAVAFGRTPFVPKANTMPTSSWWIAANREEFQQAYREQQARVIANDAPVPTAKQTGSSREHFVRRQQNHSTDLD